MQAFTAPVSVNFTLGFDLFWHGMLDRGCELTETTDATSIAVMGGKSLKCFFVFCPLSCLTLDLKKSVSAQICTVVPRCDICHLLHL